VLKINEFDISYPDTTDHSQGIIYTVLNYFVSQDASNDFKKMSSKVAAENFLPGGALETYNLWKGGFFNQGIFR
jgi:hypothetical protein